MSTIAKHRTPLARSRQRLRGGPPVSLADLDRASVVRIRLASASPDRVKEPTAGWMWAMRLLRAWWIAPDASSPRASGAREDEHLPHPA
ncbi:MAG TPA: hypothetical protein VH249_12535 [Xanthobacteraceae bacterium]|jgi:hypothetical protein|nr:hypothetical protein [Xanthobacteraceae bacterium]